MHDFYLKKEEPQQSCLLSMRDYLLRRDDSITETRKYGMPCFCYRGKAFCYLWVDKKTSAPYFLWVEGKALQHPDLEKGDRSRMKILKVNPKKDLPVESLNAILSQALEYLK